MSFYLMHRGWMTNGVFADEPFTEREAWLWLIENAAYEPCSVRVGAALVSLERGQLAHSLRFLADKWQWTKSRVQRFLGRLKIDTMIDTLNGTGVTVISVIKYDTYQFPPPAAGQRSIQTRDNSGTKKKESKETKERISPLPPKGRGDEIDQDFEIWYGVYPRKEDPGRARKAYRTARTKASAEILLHAAMRYAEQRRGEDPHYTKHPTTWLNGESWKNQPLQIVNGRNGHAPPVMAGDRKPKGTVVGTPEWEAAQRAAGITVR